MPSLILAHLSGTHFHNTSELLQQSLLSSLLRKHIFSACIAVTQLPVQFDMCVYVVCVCVCLCVAVCVCVCVTQCIMFN